MPPINYGDTAWVLASSALVLLMTPGLALFYGGMVRTKSVLNMLMMNFAAMGVVSVLWVAYGYALSFSTDRFHGLIGGSDAFGLRGTFDALTGADGDKIPVLAFAAFQLMFAIITPALISGAIADRAKFGSWILFVAVWTTVVYFPVAHWVFFFDGGNGGWIADGLKAFDFAGGTAVHVNAGAAALALVLVLGRRVGWPKEKFKPHNVPMVLLGAALLWFGWFGFNAGSALAANGLAAIAFMNTQVAAGAALVGWIIVEWLRDGRPTALGGASGAVAGLVAITPACATVEPIGAIALGLIAGAVCALAVGLKYRLGFDDSLDVVGVHLVGGALGAVLIGFLAAPFIAGTGGVAGLLYGGGFTQLGKQALAVAAVAVYSFVLAYAIGWAIEKTIGFRVSKEAEIDGIDTAEHAESAYDFAPTTGSGGAFALAGVGASRAPRVDEAEPERSGEKIPG
ncbi:ammonium transporter [Planosporangium flavigriseum]|uniref:Ammonium transporter n=2 Tax=Planosporangium flavigriseum TaxID=373681 RepID=A0A8J3LM16_9ACTN|nr:ammonium transporter [Planosporangium flavigriseum]NJC64136.1 ammonium transporter [Planosporangium flavigriseum]GIG73018.1 ammonium transporter [Planosporangium flavigriseum]